MKLFTYLLIVYLLVDWNPYSLPFGIVLPFLFIVLLFGCIAGLLHFISVFTENLFLDFIPLSFFHLIVGVIGEEVQIIFNL